jgi:hypothetical protein
LDLNKDLEAIIRRLKQVGASAKEIQAVQDTFASISKNTQQAETYIKSMTSSVERLEEVSSFASESFASLNTILMLNNNEFSKTDDIARKALRAKRSIVDVSQQMLADEKGINVLSEQQVEKLQQKLKENLSILKSQKDALISEENFLKIKEKGFDKDKNGNLLSEAALQTKIRSLTNAKELTKEQFKILISYDKTIDAEKGLLKKTEQTLAAKKHINRQMGITGDLIRSASGAMGKLGLDSKIVGDATKEAEEAMRKVAVNGSKLEVMFAGLGPLAKGFGKALTDPATILTFIVKSMLKASSQMADLRKATGLSYQAAYQLRSEMQNVADATGGSFITSTKLLKAFADMSEYIGQSAHILGGEALKSATYLTQKLKLSTEEAGNLVTMTRLQGASTEGTFKSMGKQLTSFNQANKVAFSLKDQMREVGKASTATVLQLDKSPTALLKAANNAKLLGLNLNQVEKIADSLLNFESSIEAELEAQLMTGQNLNLARARELAMVGDISGLTEELGKQEAIRNAFATKNVFAQNATAKALGISRNELAKMALQQDINTMSAENFKKEYGEVTYNSLKATSAQDKFNYALEKMQDILGSIFMRLTPVIDAFAWILDQPFAGHILAAAVAVKVLGTSFGGVMKGAQGILGIFGKIGKKAAESLGKGTSKITEMFSGASDKGKEILDKTKGADTSKLKDPATPGKNIKEFLTNLAEGLKAMGSTKVFGGALNLIPASIGFIAFIPGMVGAKLMEKLDGEKLQENLYGLAMGLEEMGKGKVILGTGALLLSAVAFTAMIPATAGMALFNLVAPTTNKLLPKFGQALVQFGALMMTGVGLLGLAALGTAAIALGFALRLAAPAIKSAGTAIGAILTGLTPIVKVVGETIIGVFKSIPGIITAVADGFVNMFSAISMDNIIPILLLGPALLGASVGIAAFAAALTGGGILSGVGSLMGGDIMSDLESLAAMSDPLATVGTSLTAIAAGIVALSSALNSLETTKLDELKDLVITTAFAAPMIAATGAITELISGISGDSQSDSNNKEIVAKLDELINATKTRPVMLNVDGTAFYNKLEQSTFKSA